MADFHAKLDVEDIKCRGDFLWKVKWAKIEDTTPYPNTENLKGLLFAMHIGLLPESYACAACGREYSLFYRKDSDTWQWRQRDCGCSQCADSRRSLTRGTVLEQVRAGNWLKFFDAYCMWTLDYPRKLMEQEIKVQHQAWLLWEKTWYAAVALDLETRLISHSLAATPPKSANRVRGVKKPAASYKRPAAPFKKPAAAKTAKKKPAASKKKVMKHILKRPAKFSAMKQRATSNPTTFYSKYKYVIEVDESHLNKSKPGALTRTGRVKPDQVWVWGATIPKMPDRFLFRVLEHPSDAEAGRPRGKEEILKCLHLLDIPRKTILVTDGWKSTRAAIEELRREKGWSKADLWQEVVNHSAGEIVNANGFTTNHIENRWSLVKRWVRKRMGGRLPLHSNRAKWDSLLKEFSWRKAVAEGSSLDYGHTWVVPFGVALRTLQAYSATLAVSD